MKPTVGEQLRSARESRGLTLEDAVKATNIRHTYLQELENDHPELLHSMAQARGFLRLYASYLGIPALPLIAQWETPAEEPAVIDDEITISPADEILSPESANEKTATEPASQVPVPDDSRAETKKDLGASLNDALSRIPKLSQFLPRKDNREEAKSQPITTEEAQPAVEQAADDREEAPQETMVVPRPSGEIFADIGEALRERRAALELTLTDIETFTNVKRMYLEAMEAGRFDDLPSTVQGRGMLNNYSQFLALDESWIMDAYAKALLAMRNEQEVSKRRKIQSPLTVRLNIPPRIRSILNPDLILGGIFIIALFGFIIWGGAQVFTASKQDPTDAPSISEMLQQTPTATAEIESTAAADSATAEATPIPGVTVVEPTPTVLATVNAAPLQLYIISSDRAYLRIVSDGNELFDGRVAAGDVFTFSGEEEISLLTGNGAALEVYFNQEYLGNLGSVGEVADMTFSLEGLSTPTPPPADTPTPAPAVDEDEAMEAAEAN